ncbi:MAG: hypothetical protein LBN99_05455 [Oscillospiraceae bacterium]|jgi:hypothetical protein|nr:hypothetical protein [Oscillospiraceae bacterium]
MNRKFVAAAALFGLCALAACVRTGAPGTADSVETTIVSAQVPLADTPAFETATPAMAELTGNFSDEMKLPRGRDLDPEGGADLHERERDDERVVSRDFYNMRSGGTLTLLPRFKTYQQSADWSSGPAAALMVLDYFGRLGAYDEYALAEFEAEGGVAAIFEEVGGLVLSMVGDATPTSVNALLSEGVPVLAHADGGWVVIIGRYLIPDLDEFIIANPYDTQDGNQDGYSAVPAEEFLEGADALFAVSSTQ